jgi:hypothetical protein
VRENVIKEGNKRAQGGMKKSTFHIFDFLPLLNFLFGGIFSLSFVAKESLLIS